MDEIISLMPTTVVLNWSSLWPHMCHKVALKSVLASIAVSTMPSSTFLKHWG